LLSAPDGIFGPFQCSSLLLRRDEVRGLNFNRIVVEFTMLNQDSTAAMDNLEGKRDVTQRVGQSMRLREVIEEQASCKFFDEQVRVGRPVVLRSNDFSVAASIRGLTAAKR
jgi:hypothetical protein